jgi:hypothetical protein
MAARTTKDIDLLVGFSTAGQKSLKKSAGGPS